MTLLPADNTPPSPPRSPPWRSELLVALALTVVAAWVLFSSLGAARMEPDESLYALATDRVRASGEWLTLRPHPPAPYFNKPPLYVWLSALTYDRVPGFEAKYRFWSALFGTAAVAMTGALGTRLFRPAVGLVAGLLLLTNRSFLRDHGARFGGMDAGLTACMAAALWLHWVGRTGAARVWPWACIGLAAGAASLLKPLAGLPIVAVIGLHAVLSRRITRMIVPPALLRDEHTSPPGGTDFVTPPLAAPPSADAPPAGRYASPRRPEQDRLGGNVGGRTHEPARQRSMTAASGKLLAVSVVVTVALAVAGPWYWINHQRFPDAFAPQLFGRQLVGSVAGGPAGVGDEPARPWFYYGLAVPASSTLWALVIPTAVWLVVATARDARRRPALLLLVLAGLGWVAGFAAPQKKFLHYVYPAFPALAVAMAACLADLLTSVAGKLRPADVAPAVAGGLRAAVVGLLAFAGHLGLVALPREGSPLPAWAVYKTFEPAIRDGRADLLFWGVPHRADDWPDEVLIRPNHMFYLSHMAGGRVVRGADDLATRPTTKRPTVLVLSRDVDLASLPALHPAGGRADERFTVEERPYAVLVTDPEALLAPALRADRPSPYLRFAGAATSIAPVPAVPPVASAAGSDTAVPETTDASFRFAGGEFAIDVTLPLPEPARLTMLIKSADGQPGRRVRCVVSGAGDESSDLQPMAFAGSHRVTASLDGPANAGDLRRIVRVKLVPVDGGDAGSIAGELVEAVLHVAPRVSSLDWQVGR